MYNTNIYFSSLTCQAHSKSHSAQMAATNMMDSLSTGHAQTILLVSRFNKVFYTKNSDEISFLFLWSYKDATCMQKLLSATFIYFVQFKKLSEVENFVCLSLNNFKFV